MKLGGLYAIALLLVAPAFVGCISDGPGDPGQTELDGTGDPALERATVPGFEPNTFLLDGDRPYTTDVSDGAEPIVHVNPDTGTLLIGDTAGIHRSTDAGVTWDTVPNPFAVGLFGDGASIAQDDEGVLYAADTNGQAIEVARSTDDGQSWDALPVEISPIADRPWVAARGDGEVALVHYDFGRTTQEVCARSTDGGMTYPDRSTLGGSPNAGNAVFDDAGDLYYADGSEDLWRWSGSCALPAQSLDIFQSEGQQVFTQVATDGQTVYAAAPTTGEDEVQLAWTSDFDAVDRTTLELPTLEANTFVALSVTADEAAIAWYGSETEGDPSDSGFDGSWNVFVARILDPTSAPETITCDDASVTCHRITDEPNHVGDLCMGGVGCGGSSDRDLLDYFGIDHSEDGRLHVAYGHDGDTDDAEVRYACLGDTCPSDTVPGGEQIGGGDGGDEPRAPAFHHNGSFNPGAGVVAGDEHRFEIPVTAGDTLDVRLGWEASTVDFDVRMDGVAFEEDGAGCQGVSQGFGPATVTASATAAEDGTARVIVDHNIGTAEPPTTYHLVLEQNGLAPSSVSGPAYVILLGSGGCTTA